MYFVLGRAGIVYVQLTFNDRTQYVICGAAAFKIQVHRVSAAYLN